MTRKICVVVTARPSYSRIKSALRAIKESGDLELQIVVAASALLERYGKVVDVMRQDGFEPDCEVHMVVEGETPITTAKTVGLGIVELASVFNTLKPDAVLTVADRYETIGTAIAGSYMNIPVVHVQGGEVTGSIDEKVRHSVTKLADLHFVASKFAAERVTKMGERPERVHVTGCPSIDVAAEVLRKADDADFQSSAYEQLRGGVGPALDIDKEFLVAIQHPVSHEWQDAGSQIEETLKAVAMSGLQCLWLWPNVDAGADHTSKMLRMYRARNPKVPIHLLRNMGPEEFLFVLNKASCIVGNSSVGLREAAYLGVPCINVGTRQTGRDRAENVKDVDYNHADILAALESHRERGRYQSDSIYGDGRAGERIGTLLAQCDLVSEKRLTY